MIPAKQMAELLTDMIAKEPLRDGEVRLALDRTMVAADFTAMATLTIHGTPCQRLRRLTDTAP